MSNIGGHDRRSAGKVKDEENCIVLYPYPTMGHLIPMVELGKRFLNLTVVVVVAEAPFVLPNIDAYIKTVTETHPSIVFLRLPSLPSFTAEDYYPPRLRTIELAFEFTRAANPLLRLALPRNINIRALFVDLFGYPAMEVADEVGVPAYVFMTSPAAALALYLYLPTMQYRHVVDGSSFNDGSVVEFPGLPPLPADDLPQGLEDRDQKAYGEFVEMGKRFATAAGFVVNSFDSLETRAVKALTDGVCVPGGPTPPCYMIRPMIAHDGGGGDGGGGGGGGEDDDYCLKWLESQPRRSVVFLSFGSMAAFPREQLREIAGGLERSGHRFLWVLRDGGGELLPEGFEERTRGRGLVWRSWAAQAAVLSRDSVGAFVTHCGWNSVLESVSAGVPMVAWPLYAEQRMIRVLVTEEMRLGVAVDFDGATTAVTAAELERRVREVMDDSVERTAMRERAEAMKAAAAAASRDGGSSHLALLRLVNTLKQNRPVRLGETTRANK